MPVAIVMTEAYHRSVITNHMRHGFVWTCWKKKKKNNRSNQVFQPGFPFRHGHVWTHTQTSREWWMDVNAEVGMGSPFRKSLESPRSGPFEPSIPLMKATDIGISHFLAHPCKERYIKRHPQLGDGDCCDVSMAFHITGGWWTIDVNITPCHVGKKSSFTMPPIRDASGDMLQGWSGCHLHPYIYIYPFMIIYPMVCTWKNAGTSMVFPMKSRGKTSRISAKPMGTWWDSAGPVGFTTPSTVRAGIPFTIQLYQDKGSLT